MKKKIKNPKEDDEMPAQQKYIPINYVDGFTNKIGNIFKKSGYTPAFKVKTKPIPTYRKLTSTETKLDDKKGVYKISCSSNEQICNKEYIGYTNRSIFQRFKEHNTAHYRNPGSLVAKHLKENPGHNIQFPDSLQLLKNINNKAAARVHESFAIYKHVKNNAPDSLLNKQEDFRNSITFKTMKYLEESTPPVINNRHRHAAAVKECENRQAINEDNRLPPLHSPHTTSPLQRQVSVSTEMTKTGRRSATGIPYRRPTFDYHRRRPDTCLPRRDQTV